jgi:hypothetical protein
LPFPGGEEKWLEIPPVFVRQKLELHRIRTEELPKKDVKEDRRDGQFGIEMCSLKTR